MSFVPTMSNFPTINVLFNFWNLVIVRLYQSKILCKFWNVFLWKNVVFWGVKKKVSLYYISISKVITKPIFASIYMICYLKRCDNVTLPLISQKWGALILSSVLISSSIFSFLRNDSNKVISFIISFNWELEWLR